MLIFKIEMWTFLLIIGVIQLCYINVSAIHVTIINWLWLRLTIKQFLLSYRLKAWILSLPLSLFIGVCVCVCVYLCVGGLRFFE